MQLAFLHNNASIGSLILESKLLVPWEYLTLSSSHAICHLHMLRFCFTKVLLNIGVKSQLISIHNGKWSKQTTLSIIETFDTRDLPEVVETQLSNQDVVSWAWLTNVKVSGKSKDLSIKHKLFISQKFINSDPKTDSDCMPAL